MAIESKPVIAIVDDHPGLRKALARLLSLFGYRVEQFASGAEFLSAPAASEAACLVLDIHLGEGTGLELARQLSTAGFKVPPIIFMTALEDESLRRQCVELGAVAFLQKPFVESELRKVFATLLSGDQDQFASDQLSRGDDPRVIFENLVEEAIRVTGADMGNIQLIDASTGALHIVAHQGFAPQFLNFFAVVERDNSSACGVALKQSSRIVVPDVEMDPIFAGKQSESILRNAKVRAVQSTPLLDSSGNLIGMISTHWRSVTLPSDDALKRLDGLCRDTGAERLR